MQSFYLSILVEWDRGWILKLNYIITRNVKDFKNSTVQAVMPEQLLALL